MTSIESVLIRPIVTEKTVHQKNKFLFLVNGNANKEDVRRAVKDFYGVEVEKVNITILPEKARLVGRGKQSRKRAEQKKAVVTLKEGATIDFNAFK